MDSQNRMLGGRQLGQSRDENVKKRALMRSLEQKEKDSAMKFDELVNKLNEIEESDLSQKSVLKVTLINAINMIAQFREVIEEVKTIQLTFDALTTTLGIVDDSFKLIHTMVQEQIAQDPGAFYGSRVSAEVEQMGRSINRRFDGLGAVVGIMPKLHGFMGNLNNKIGRSMGKANKIGRKKSSNDDGNYGAELSPQALAMINKKGMKYSGGNSGGSADGGNSGGKPLPPSSGKPSEGI